MSIPNIEIIELVTVDSTNNYAMKLIDQDLARHGMMVLAQEQTAGKGQRGRKWVDRKGESLLMSLIVCPQYGLQSQFQFSATVAVAIAKYLQKCIPNGSVAIKWPNDIIINDKKSAGVLIENVIRGSQWAYSVIGLGLNVQQTEFGPDLPHATSLNKELPARYNIRLLAEEINSSILSALETQMTEQTAISQYNFFLYKRNQLQTFSTQNHLWQGIILGANANGTLTVLNDQQEPIDLVHGASTWVYPT